MIKKLLKGGRTLKIGNRAAAFLLSLVMVLTLVPPVFAEDDGSAATGDQEYTIGLNLSGEHSIDLYKPQTVTATIHKADTQEPVDGIPDGYTVVWTTSNNYEEGGVAGITLPADANGKLSITFQATAVAPPSQKDPITLTVSLMKGDEIKSEAKCHFRVQNAEPPSLTINHTGDIEIAPGGTQNLTATPKPEGTPTTITWSSDTPKIAKVDEATGVVTGVAPGVATITATNGVASDTVQVTVIGIVLKETEITMNERESRTVTYEVFGKSLKNGTPIFMSSNEEAATVTGDSSAVYISAYSPGETTITIKIGTYTSAGCKVTVKKNVANPIPYSLSAGATLNFNNIESSLRSECLRVTGESLSYISSLQVSTEEGTLYNRFQSDADTGAGIGNLERFYVTPGTGQMDIDAIGFVPKSTFSGTATIYYSGYGYGGAAFQGTIAVTVAQQKDITYTVKGNKPVQMNPDDFNRICQSKTGRDISFVMFSLPGESRGTLRYQYVSEQNPGYEVETDKEYRRNGSPSLSEVYFLPAAYNGTVAISYTGYDVNGDSFYGTVYITVSGVTGTGGDITYTIEEGEVVSLDDRDFNSISYDITGRSVSRVQFTQPRSSVGTLYYKYDTASSEKVTEGKSYYRNSSPYIDDITFKPANGFVGTATISFTGWDSWGVRFSGSLVIQVEEEGSAGYLTGREAMPILKTMTGLSYTFDSDDFIKANSYRGEGSLLSVQFTLPGTNAGVLYYDFTGMNGKQTKVSSTASYMPMGSPNLSRVTFVPKPGYRGTVVIRYTGLDSEERSFSGQILLTVTPPTASRYFNDVWSYSWAVPAIDLLYESGVVSGVGNGSFHPGGSIKRGDFMLMLCRAFGFSTTGTSTFYDVRAGSYYAGAIGTAQRLGIAGGYADGSFRPEATVTRQDAMVFLKRAMAASGIYLGTGIQSVLNSYYDGYLVSDYARDAVSGMVTYGVLTGSNSTLSPLKAMTRAELTVVLARAMMLS